MQKLSSSDMRPANKNMVDEHKRQLKKELMEIFRKFGYPLSEKDHEVTFRTTSGNVAWISINRIETIK